MGIAAAAGCGEGDECGPGDAPVDGVTAALANNTVTYGSFTSSPDGNCTTGTEPSLSIEGIQVDPAPIGGTTQKIAFCIPLPDAVGGDPMTLGLEDTDPVRLVEVNASVDPCTYRFDFSPDPSGTITFSGYCDSGLHEAGYAITLDGSVTLRQVCGGDLETIIVDLAGSAAVRKR